MKSWISVFFITVGIPLLAVSQTTAAEIIQSSIAYHDPGNVLGTKVWTMHFEESRPDGRKDPTHFRFDPTTYDFEVERGGADKRIQLKMNGDVFSATFNGSSDISLEDAKAMRIDESRATFMRDYYHYLWCLPMKLNDPGTIIDPEVKTVDFFGKASLQIKVTYTPEVGEDIWYFYFHPTTKALQGYRFYHDESIPDGEYILLDGELESNGVKIPQSRRWMTHKDDKFLGKDKLIRLELLPKQDE